jgi:Spy/CpxP family protein refolding chaperone
MRSIAVVGAVVMIAMCICSGAAFCKSPASAHPKNQHPGTTGKVQANGESATKGQSPASGGCGMLDPMGALNLTPAQKARLSEIDNLRVRKTQRLQVKADDLDKGVTRLAADPKASDAKISDAVHKLADTQAELYMVQILAQREADKIYTQPQKAMLAKSKDCGCGSPAGGCGSGCGSNCGSSAEQPATSSSNK